MLVYISIIDKVQCMEITTESESPSCYLTHHTTPHHITPHHTTQHTQPGHVCCRSSKWDSSKGLVIMGGDGASTTTEILRDDLTSVPYFDITETR